MAIRPELQHLAVPISTLSPYPRNARMGDTEAIRASLRTHGQFRPLIVQESTGWIVCGNHTYFAACEEGWSEIAVTVLDLDDDQAARINLVDNRTQELGEFDAGLLASQLQDLESLVGTGYDEAALKKLLDEAEKALNLDEREACPECGKPL